MRRETVWLSWSKPPQRGISGRISPRSAQKEFKSKNEAVIFAVESKEIRDLDRHTIEMTAGGAIYGFDDINAIYARYKEADS